MRPIAVEYAGDEEEHPAAGVDGVVGVALVEAAEQRAVDRGLDAVAPGRAEQHHEQPLVQLVHRVVVGLELGRVDRVRARPAPC